jgi:hypothetical protein
VLALALVAPSLAQAASKPTVTTGTASKLAAQTVTLNGKVTPNGANTTYLFQWGTSTIYGQSTPQGTVASGAGTVPVSTDLNGLNPVTTYHYRLVAHNSAGTTNGADHTFKTRALPLGLSLAATPNPVPFGAPTTLAGALTGTGNAGKPVVLLGNPFPYTQGFVAVGNPQVTAADGGFSFALLSVPINTQYRVEIAGMPQVSSPIVGVGVSVIVSTQVGALRVHKGHLVRFMGAVRPARPGAQVAIQKQRGTDWITVAGTITHTATANFSRYAKRVRIRRGGNFRVFVAINDGNFVSSVGRTVRIHVR